jgi:hypothetical protein
MATEHQRHVAAARRAGFKVEPYTVRGERKYQVVYQDGVAVWKGYRFKETAELAAIGKWQKLGTRENPIKASTETYVFVGLGVLVVGGVGWYLYSKSSASSSTNSTVLAALSNAASAQVAAANAQGNSPASLNPDAEPPFVSGT